MTEEPIFLSKDDSLEKCAKEMESHHVGTVLVQEGTIVSGIISEQDIVRKVVAKPDIEWNGDGTYARTIAGKRMTKVLMGKPN